MADISWASLADVGLGVVGGLAQGWAARSQARAQQEIEREQNRVASSRAMLARTVQEINNRRILRRGGQQRDAAVRQFAYATDIGTREGFEASIQAAEAMGRAGVQAAAGGLGGALVGAASSVAQLAVSRAAEYRRQDRADRTYEQLQALTSIMPDAIRSTDTSPIVAQQSYEALARGTPSMAGFLLNGLLSKRDSAQTFLGSLADQTPVLDGIHVLPELVSTPAGTPESTNLGGGWGAVSRPVVSSNIQGTALPSITIN